MSSSSVAYIVAPNTATGGTSTIPNPTQLNGTGALVDLVPQIIRNQISATSVLLDNTANSTTTVYTSPSAVSGPGTYLVSANFLIDIAGTSWTNAEAILLSISMTGGGVSTTPFITLQPSYFSQFPATNQPVAATVTGLLTTTIAGQIICRVSRFGTPSANKYGGIFSLTCQKIA
jgi:hypothetical protein